MSIKTMCREILTQADMKAIANVRGFNKESLKSRDKFEKYFDSMIGLREAIESLSDAEKVFLYYMGNDRVDVEFFARLWPQEKHLYATYTQKYNDLYKLIQNNLLRKGLLVVQELSCGLSRMERWRFNVPLLFRPYLPGSVVQTSQLSTKSVLDGTIRRDKIFECLKTSIARDSSKKVHIKNGVFCFGEKQFSIDSLESWCKNRWVEESVLPQKNTKVELSSAFKQHLIASIQKMSVDEWFNPSALSHILKFIAYGDKPINEEKVCEVGFKYSFLRKTLLNGKTFYARADVFNDNDLNQSPASYLKQEADGFLIDLSKIPYHSLDQLAKYGYFSVVKNKLTVKFSSLVKIDTTFLQSSLLHWMRSQLPLLENQINQIQLKHGKVLLHKNLCVAKMNDLRLKACLVKSCQNIKEVIFLPNDYLVFPQSFRAELERIIKRNGYAIRKN